MSDPRIAIIGAGNLSTRRIYPNVGAAGARIVGVCDLDTEKAERNAGRFGGRAFEDLNVMLDIVKPDGVIVCIGPEAHANIATQVLRLGYPVYTEKPPAASAEDALAVARVAAETGLICTTAFKKRYSQGNNRAVEWLRQFPVEDRYMISIDYCSAQYKNESPRSSFLLDFCIHIIDLVGYLFGDVSRVFTFARGLDAYAVSLMFTSGAVGTLSLNCGRSFRIPTDEIEISVKGGNFMTLHNSSCWRITENQKTVEWREPPTFTSSGDSGNDTGHLAEIVDYVEALKEGRKTTRSNIYESYKSLVLYEAIKASAENESVVDVVYETLS
ncbi:MAG: Gfo/Idh/MocA family oxidoreductase [Bacteroidetes bacterium]|nr:Gfo/Idh/MocA family oxidoreductase [Bacteroidota bacterium]